MAAGKASVSKAILYSQILETPLGSWFTVLIMNRRTRG